MSGPIVRKYGFPNFEKIFGERGLQHGVDEAEAGQAAAEEAKAPASADTPPVAEKPAPAPRKKD
jgi:hypothetical protein